MPANPRIVDASTIRAYIGACLRPDARDAPFAQTMGAITLHPHQHSAARRIRDAMCDSGGAVLADDVGLGKTYTALAVTREYRRTLVVAPAPLLPMWRRAIAMSGASGVSVQSLHAFSRSPAPDGVASGGEFDLLVVDEAHTLRNRSTRRYRSIAQLALGRHILLLSATPIHNTTNDLGALLALFLGQRSDTMSEQHLAELVVRRTAGDVAAADGQPTIGTIPTVLDRGALIARDRFDEDTLERLLAIPEPLPVCDGAAAGALIRMGLIRAMVSSPSALTAALRRRMLRASAVRDALIDGRHLSSHDLEAFVLSPGAMQLALPELLGSVAPTHGVGDPDPRGDAQISISHPRRGAAIATLDAHVTAIADIVRAYGRPIHHDASGALGFETDVAFALTRLMTRGDRPTIVAFSQYRETLRSLYRRLRKVSGIGMLTGAGGEIASGHVARRDLLARFAPEAQGVPPPADHERVRLLLTTDILAEGVNLQDANVVVHLDLPWTDALRSQRVGRAARMGSRFTQVEVYTVPCPDPAEAAIGLLERIARKARAASDTLGGSTHPPPDRTWESTRPGDSLPHRALPSPHPAPSPSAVTAQSRLTNRLRAWAHECDVSQLAQPPSISASPLLTLVDSPTFAWLALVEREHVGDRGSSPGRVVPLEAAMPDPPPDIDRTTPRYWLAGGGETGCNTSEAADAFGRGSASHPTTDATSNATRNAPTNATRDATGNATATAVSSNTTNGTIHVASHATTDALGHAANDPTCAATTHATSVHSIDHLTSLLHEATSSHPVIETIDLPWVERALTCARAHVMWRRAQLALGSGTRALTLSQRRCLVAIDACVRDEPVARRPSMTGDAWVARDVVSRAAAIGASAALDAWCDLRPTMSAATWLSAWTQSALLARLSPIVGRPAAEPAASGADSTQVSLALRALVVFRPVGRAVP